MLLSSRERAKAWLLYACMLAFVIAVIVHAHCNVLSPSHALLIAPSDYLKINLAQWGLALWHWAVFIMAG